ncbi:MAG: hypothetical protein J0M24_26060 [Verrucomicrobia bacterium]|nr:hypothetical protein [Verrucomicrobiota bacterium]
MHSVDDYVGQTLDEKYRLERRLGQGGMGTVYLRARPPLQTPPQST